MTLDLGADPDDLIVRLYRGIPFGATLTLVDDDDQPKDYDVGAGLQIRLGRGHIYDAEIIGADATWRVPSTEIDIILTEVSTQARIDYVSPEGDAVPWFEGRLVEQ